MNHAHDTVKGKRLSRHDTLGAIANMQPEEQLAPDEWTAERDCSSSATRDAAVLGRVRRVYSLAWAVTLTADYDVWVHTKSISVGRWVYGKGLF